MKVAVLGTGFGSYHVELYKSHPMITDIIVWGRNTEKLDEIKEKYSVTTTTDFDTILNDPDIELVDVCVPSAVHAEYAVSCLEHGKHVFLETPVSYTLEDAKKIQAAALKNNRTATVDLFTRFDFPYTYVADIKNKNTYGALHSFTIFRETPPWFGDLGKERIALNLMVHDMDFTVSMLGSPDDIKSYTLPTSATACIVNSILTYKDTYVQVQAASCMAYGHPFRIGYEAIFDKAVVRYYEEDCQSGTETKLMLYTDPEHKEIPLPSCNSYEHAIDYVLNYITTPQTSLPKNDISEAIKSLECLLTI